MKAVIFEDFGGPEVLHMAEVDAPTPGPKQVRIRTGRCNISAPSGRRRAMCSIPARRSKWWTPSST